MHFRKNLVACSSAGPKILAFSSHFSANFQPILNCFIPNFKLKFDNSQNIKAYRVNTVVSNLNQIKRRAFILGHPVYDDFMLILIDIDECKTGTHQCNQFGECSNTDGSHQCNCKAGYAKSGLFNCTGK